MSKQAAAEDRHWLLLSQLLLDHRPLLASSVRRLVEFAIEARGGEKVRAEHLIRVAKEVGRSIPETVQKLREHSKIEEAFAEDRESMMEELVAAMRANFMIIEVGEDRLRQVDGLSGAQLRLLMKMNETSTFQLAERMGVGLTKVRDARRDGISDKCTSREWYEAITEQGAFSSWNREAASYEAKAA